MKKKNIRKGNLQRILATVFRESREERLQPERDRKPLEKDQCPYFKEMGPQGPSVPQHTEAGGRKSQALGKVPQNIKGVSPW